MASALAMNSMSESERQEHEFPASVSSKGAAKSVRLLRSNQKWDLIKDEIHRLYLKEDSTLQTTMETMEKEYGVRASKRKWKEKLKEWEFDKNIPASKMRILVAKAEERAREEGKETVFFCGDTQIPAERMERFKRRKRQKSIEASPSAATPTNFSYHTPCAERTESISGISICQINENIEDPTTSEIQRETPSITEKEFATLSSEAVFNPTRITCHNSEIESESNNLLDDVDASSSPNTQSIRIPTSCCDVDEAPESSLVVTSTSPSSSNNTLERSQPGTILGGEAEDSFPTSERTYQGSFKPCTRLLSVSKSLDLDSASHYRVFSQILFTLLESSQYLFPVVHGIGDYITTLQLLETELSRRYGPSHRAVLQCILCRAHFLFEEDRLDLANEAFHHAIEGLKRLGPIGYNTEMERLGIEWRVLQAIGCIELYPASFNWPTD